MTPEWRISNLRIVRKRSGQRVAVELDNGETIEIDPEIAVRSNLKSGAAIAADAIEQLRVEDEHLRARRRLIGYLSLRVKSVADARLYLQRAGFGESAIAAAIEHAVERGLLDDRRFAERFVRTKLKTGAVGPLRLVAELVAHGIAPSLANQVVQPQFDRDWQMEAARTLASKRVKIKSAEDKLADIKRLYDWLRARGFEDDVAREAAERALRR